MSAIWEVTPLRVTGEPIPEDKRRAPYLGWLIVEKQQGRRTARLIPRFDSPHPDSPSYLFDPKVLALHDDKLVLDGVEAGWDTKAQKAVERRQTWGCRRVG